MTDNINSIHAEPVHGKHSSQPKMNKGGVFAAADIKLIKDALIFYVKHNGNITDAEERQTSNLLHRLTSRA